MSRIQEENLLLLCSRVNLDSEGRQKIKELSSTNLDWEYLLNTSLIEGLFGLLYKNLKNARIAIPHQKEFKELERGYYQNLAKNMILLREFDSLLRPLHEAQIPVILLKGAAFLKTIYRDVGLRYLDDIDILIKDEHLDSLGNFFKKNGFSPLPFYPDRYSKGSLIIDIHTDLFNISRIGSRDYAVSIDYEAVWRDAKVIDPDYPNLFMLSACDQILLQSLHSLKHSYAQLIWFVDMNEIIHASKNDLNWDKLLERAESFNLTRPLYYCLFYLKNRMKSPVPDFLFNRNIKFNYLERKALNLIQRNEKINRYGELLLVYSIPKMFHRLRYLFELLFPRPSVLSQVFGFYSLPLIPLLYILRIFQLLYIIPRESLRFFSKALIFR